MLSQPPIDRRVRKSRKALRDALQHLLPDKPFEQITLQEITDRADVAYTTFFRNYPDKEALFIDLAEVEIDKLLDLALPLFSARHSEVSTLAMCEFVQDDRPFWTALLTGGAVGNVRALFIAKVDARADQCPAQPGWLPPDFGTTILCNITLDVLSLWLGKRPEAPPAEISALLSKFFAVIASDAA